MLGVVPQELVYDPFFTVRETLRIQSGYFGFRNNDDWIDEILANLGLSDKADSNMRALSGGMKRRVLVAQAAAGIAAYLKKHSAELLDLNGRLSVVIGFDGRINSDVFAEDSAQIFAAAGIDTVLVNGVPVWAQGRETGARPGQVLTRQRSA